MPYPYPVKPCLMLPCTSCTVALCAKVVCVPSSPGPGVANFLMASLVLQGYCCMVRVSLCVPVASFWCRADSFVWWLHKPTKAWLVLAMLVPAAADSSDALQKERVQHSFQQARETRPRQASQALCCRHDVSWAVQHGCVAARLLVGQAASVVVVRSQLVLGRMVTVRQRQELCNDQLYPCASEIGRTLVRSPQAVFCM